MILNIFFDLGYIFVGTDSCDVRSRFLVSQGAGTSGSPFQKDSRENLRDSQQRYSDPVQVSSFPFSALSVALDPCFLPCAESTGFATLRLYSFDEAKDKNAFELKLCVRLIKALDWRWTLTETL